MHVVRKMKVSAIGASTVTLVAADYAGEPRPDHLIGVDSMTMTYPGTPPAALWGTVGDGAEYEVTIRRNT